MQGIHTLLNHCPRLTHLSLTGVQAFLREDLTEFCRDPPAEFTAQQRGLFCVFSGDGVSSLRNYLNHAVFAYPRDTGEESVYDDADEMEDDVTGLMGATGISDSPDEEMPDVAPDTAQT